MYGSQGLRDWVGHLRLQRLILERCFGCSEQLAARLRFPQTASEIHEGLACDTEREDEVRGGGSKHFVVLVRVIFLTLAKGILDKGFQEELAGLIESLLDQADHPQVMKRPTFVVTMTRRLRAIE